MTARTDQARKLELSGVEEVGDFVTGRARGLAVSLEGEPPFSACVVELGGAIPIARMVMRAGDLNHPDAVETGDAAFDERMQVTALSTYAPTLQQMLADLELREALLDFFGRNPDAAFAGARLRVPAGPDGVTQKLIGDGLWIAEKLSERFAEIGFLENEPQATLPPGSTSRINPFRVVGFGAWGAVIWAGVASVIGLGLEPASLGMGAMCIFLAALTGALVDREQK